MKKTRECVVAFRVSATLLKKLDRLAEHHRRTRSGYLAVLVQQHVAESESVTRPEKEAR